MPSLSGIVDGLLDATIAPGFSRVGYEIRSRSTDWETFGENSLSDRVIVVTGATSGLGLATVRRLRSLGASLVLVGRDRDRTERTRRSLLDELPHGASVDVVVADMAEPSQVRAASSEIARMSRLDALIHNAGSLSKQRLVNSQGLESTLAAQVVGPFIMTTELLSLLERSQGRVITVSSGGMYAAALADMSVASPDPRCPEVHFAAMHPGWADTPGVRSSLPGFARFTGPFLRDADQGADTTVWLAATDRAHLAASGGFWCDRRRRATHRLPSTRRSDTEAGRRALWEWCVARSSAGA
ncbi:MAG: SDR family NAD(P)-dependent oxidoreductase [Acidimicrobiia bacterium]|nr:SDR family NAD(P)-dependent oxidoreductase [Acidimicrobiia bacterium]